MNIEQLGKRTANGLITLAAKIQNLEHIKSVVLRYPFRDLNGDALFAIKADIQEKVEPCFSIYQFRLTEATAISSVDEMIAEARQKNVSGRAFPRVNVKKGGDPFSLYVGSSRKTPRRLVEHIGLGSHKTYSLQLCHWANSLEGEFLIEVHSFQANEENFELVPLMEDHLGNELQPRLGRKGRL